MSLQVWLPFTDGTLKQQGLSSAAATSGGTVNLTNVGKLGKCATLGTAAGGITLPASTMTSFTKCSVAFWIKIISWNTSYATLFQAGLGSTPWNNYIFGILRNNANSNLCFTLTNSSSSSTNASYVSSNLEVGQWYHLAFVYNTGVCKIYINGVEDKSYNTSYVPNFAGITHISIGRGTNGSSYQTNCSLNDFRIYDHALSPMEIKWLSQGLVLYYPLNRNGWGQENLLKNTMVENSHVYNSSSLIYYYFNFSGNLPAGTYTFSFDIKSSNGTDGCYFSYANGSSTLNRIGRLNTIPNSWTHYSYTFTSSATNCNDIFFAHYTGHGGTDTPNTNNTGIIYVKNVKLETGNKETSWCPATTDTLYTTMGLNSTTEYDCSGFCNNGTRTGTFTWTSDTPKYAVSTHISSTSQKILISNFPTSEFGNSYSFAWWGKRSSNSPMFWGFSNGIRLNGMYSGTLWNTGDSSNNPIYKPGTTTTITAPSINVWHHYVMTGDGTTCKLYLDGELYGQAKTYKAISGTTIYINGWDSSTAYCSDNTDMSDFRIYATALSAEDVKSLYQNCATIDPDGTIRGQIRS